jgi:hypothetical protein
MRPDKDLAALLRAHDDRLRQTPMSLAAQIRMRQMLPVQRPERRWTAIALIAGAAIGAAATLAVSAGFQRARSMPWEEGGAVTAVDAGACWMEERSDGPAFSGRCTLQLRTATVRTEATAELRQREDGIEMLSGRAWFEVARVSAGYPPVRVRVAGGVIEVVGTKFVVDQGATDGSVELFEGVIRFRAQGRDPVELHPGEKFRWTNAPPPSSSPPTPEPAAESAAPPASSPPLQPPKAPPLKRSAVPQENDAETPENIAQRVMSLREEGRYREAAAALAELRSKKVDLRTAEVLSFEEGDVLEHLGDNEAACAHWREHARRFPSGKYREFVATKAARLGCP